MTHDITATQLANLNLVLESGNAPPTMSQFSASHNFHGVADAIGDLNEKLGYTNIAFHAEGAADGLSDGEKLATKLLDSLEKAGYQITKKHPHKVAVAVNEDWGVKYVTNGRTNWVRDSHGFPALFSEEKAKNLCTSSAYTAQRLRLVAYELNFDTPA